MNATNPLYRLFNYLPTFAQNAGFTVASYLRNRNRYTPYFYEVLNRWEASANAPLSELKAVQRKQLDAVVEQARTHVPYYKDIPSPSDHPDDVEAIRRTLENIPMMDKETYRERFDDLRNPQIPSRKLRVRHTSGTTGSSLAIYHTAERFDEYNAAVWRARRAQGVGLHDPQIQLGGRAIGLGNKPPFWRVDWHLGQTRFSVYNMTPKNLPAYIEAIHRAPARYIVGYPSALHIVGRAMLDAGRPLPPGRIKGAFPSSESLLAFQKDIIEKAFSAPVFDHYAAEEKCVSMTACTHGQLHVDMEFCIVEVAATEETDDYVRGPLIVTGLGMDATPFLRFKIGDVGTLSKHPCPCGRPGDVFLEIDGRIEDYITTPDGRLVGRMDHVFKQQHEIAEAQILQDTPEMITVLIVPRATYSEASQRKLLRDIHDRLGKEIQVNIRITDSIPREDNGKLRAVKSSVGMDL